MANSITPSAHLPTVCGNCAANLSGPYCCNCGQHAHESVRSIGALLHDAWHIATHVDSRFWKSMYYLLLKPGRLTQEYFADHRARFLPPVRVYLVLSVLFFAFIVSTPPVSSPADAEPARAKSQQKVHADLAEPGVLPAAASAASPVGHSKKSEDADEEVSIAGKDFFDNTGGFSQCKNIKWPWPWVAKHMREACARNNDNIAEPALQAFLHNLPRMMVVFAPLVAIAMLLIYWAPRRYYVEHVVYFLHNHAAVFLIWLVVALLAWIGKHLHWRGLRSWAIVIGILYMLWYVYKSMRVFYGQSRFLTLSKMTFMYFVYFLALTMTVAATLLISVATV